MVIMNMLRTKLHGPTAQAAWQAGIGFSVFIIFVGIPATLDYMSRLAIRKRLSASTGPELLGNRNPLQERVHAHRLQLRAIEENKNE